MKVTAKTLNTGKTIEIVGDANEMIANTILNAICWFEEVVDDNAYYGSYFDFTIDNIDEIKKHILMLASIDAQNYINTVHITVYNDNIAVKELIFTNVIKDLIIKQQTKKTKMKVTAKTKDEEKTIEIVSDSKNTIAHVILDGLCWLSKVVDREAYYGSDFDFNLDVDDMKEIEDYIISAANCRTCNYLRNVHIAIYNDNTVVKELLFTNKR